MEAAMPIPRIDPIIRFSTKFIVLPNGCWQWIGPMSTMRHGLKHPSYGMFRPGGRANNVGAHRWSYEYHKGKIPPGLVLDHLCRNTLCVNPDHLEPVTDKVNRNRGDNYNGQKTHCRYGHEFTAQNTYVTRTGARRCRKCHAIDEHYRHYAAKAR